MKEQALFLMGTHGIKKRNKYHSFLFAGRMNRRHGPAFGNHCSRKMVSWDMFRIPVVQAAYKLFFR